MALLLVTESALEFFSSHESYIDANSVKYTYSIWISRVKFKYLNSRGH